MTTSQLKLLKAKIKESMEDEREMCRDMKNHEWFSAIHTGRYEAYERVLEMLKEIE